MRCGRGPGVLRTVSARTVLHEVRLEVPVEAVDRVEDRDVKDRQCPRRLRWRRSLRSDGVQSGVVPVRDDVGTRRADGRGTHENRQNRNCWVFLHGVDPESENW